MALRNCDVHTGGAAMVQRSFKAHGGASSGPVAVATLSALTIAGVMYWMSLGVASASSEADPEEEDDELPEFIDWEERGAVNTPRNQGYCGSCWAHATVGSVEGIHKIKWDEVVSLSVQHVIDCAVRRVGTEDIEGKGCDGGLLYMAFEFVKKYGLVSEKDYPHRWLLRHGRCRSLGMKIASHIHDYHIFEPSEEALMKAVSRQPVAVDVDHFPMVEYKGGIIEIEDWPPAENYADTKRHCVLVVGYGTDEDGNKFWRIKNSYGPGWGEKGFAKLRRGTADKCGVGGITCYPGYYPIIY